MPPWPAAYRRTDEHMRSPTLPFRMYYGPEFLAAAFVAWAERNGVEIVYIQPGKPTQNAFIERFNHVLALAREAWPGNLEDAGLLKILHRCFQFTDSLDGVKRNR